MSNPPRILVLGADEEAGRSLLESIQSPTCIVCTATDDGWPTDATVEAVEFSGAVMLGDSVRRLPALLAFENVLKHLPEGVAVLDSDLRIRWCNDRLIELTGRNGPGQVSPIGLSFHDAFGAPQIIGPDFSPFHTALGGGTTARTTYCIGDRTYLDVLAAPVFATGADYPSLLVVTARDISAEHLQGEKLTAIHQAGQDLGDLSPEDLASLSVAARKELLKERIIHHTKDVLHFETIEVRLLNERTNRLEPLLNVGMTAEAAARELFAEPVGNGVTGFVAAEGKSYLCRDTAMDELYLQGAVGARSSLTVPLTRHDRVLGTFNVESTQTNAFSEQDQQFLELFCRDLAVALNTLELLVFERVAIASESSTVLLRDAAKPVDEILSDIAWLQNKYVGFDPEAAGRLQRMLKQTRTIRQLIHGIGEKVAPSSTTPAMPQVTPRPKLRQKRVLVADAEESVCQAAHELLGRYGCEVEATNTGDDALAMIRSFHYDVVLFDAEMTDLHLITALTQIRDMHPLLPVIIMKGFGYDGAHRMVNARQMGFKLALYKPFKVELLLAELEKALAPPPKKVERRGLKVDGQSSEPPSTLNLQPSTFNPRLSMPDYTRELQAALSAVRVATQLCRSVQATITPEVLDKKDNSPVTIADFGSQAVVCRVLGDAFCIDPIIAEEDSAALRLPENAAFLSGICHEVQRLGIDATAEQICQWIDRGDAVNYSPRFWTLDPIDGTKGFLRKGQYAVSLALIVEGRIEVGVLGCPNLPLSSHADAPLDVLCYAVRGQGAFIVPLEENATPWPIHVSETTDPRLARFCESVEAAHSAHDDSVRIAKLLGMSEAAIRMDSQAKYATVAQGRVDAYLRLPTKAGYFERIWDHAGGVIVVEEAGGRVTDMCGLPLDFTRGQKLTQNRGVIVTNGLLHDQIVSVVKSVVTIEG